MNPIVLAILIVSVIGLIAGLGLAVASIVMAVPVDKKAEAIRECLPGANCGACGFSGCDGYAAALSEGKTKETNLCAPGGADAAKGVA
ncbi:MAG: RnfABCDGE type electron transport complex subunit B, partial [Acutalibacteraceae bacterium]|nr:RnfABCDGE type electron transport complex subunit B [Acutalibacteraceae bacterium]